MIFGVDNLEALDNRKVMARRRLNGRQIVFHGAGPLFHHHKLLKGAQAAPGPWPAPKTLLEQPYCRYGSARPDNPAPALVDASIGRCSGERTIIVVFGGSRIAGLRTQNQRKRCRNEEIEQD